MKDSDIDLNIFKVSSQPYFKFAFSSSFRGDIEKNTMEICGACVKHRITEAMVVEKIII